MYRIRLMYAIVLATAFMLLIAWTGAIAVNPASTFYAELNKPAFIVSGGWFSMCTSVVYCIFIYLFARLISYKKYTPCMPLMAVINVLSALWTVVFFRAHSVLGGLILLLIIVVLNFWTISIILKRKWPLALLYLPVLLWHAYLFILNYAIFILN